MYFGLLTKSIDMDGSFYSLDDCGSVVTGVGRIREVKAQLVIVSNQHQRLVKSRLNF